MLNYSNKMYASLPMAHFLLHETFIAEDTDS